LVSVICERAAWRLVWLLVTLATAELSCDSPAPRLALVALTWVSAALTLAIVVVASATVSTLRLAAAPTRLAVASVDIEALSSVTVSVALLPVWIAKVASVPLVENKLLPLNWVPVMTLLISVVSEVTSCCMLARSLA
jgi:hypothetical protein